MNFRYEDMFFLLQVPLLLLVLEMVIIAVGKAAHPGNMGVYINQN